MTTAPVTVCIPAALIHRTGRRQRVPATGRTIRDLIQSLDGDYPGLRFNICHETGELRPFVNVFLGCDNIRSLEGLDTRVEAGDTVHIIHSVAGG